MPRLAATWAPLVLVIAACTAGKPGPFSSTPYGEGAIEALDASLAPKQGFIYFRVWDTDANISLGDLWEASLPDAHMRRLTSVRNVSYVGSCGSAIYVGAPLNAPPGEIGADVLQEYHDGSLRVVPGFAEAVRRVDGRPDNVALGPEPNHSCMWAFTRPRSDGLMDVITWNGREARRVIDAGRRQWRPYHTGWYGSKLAIVSTQDGRFQVRLDNGRGPVHTLPADTRYAAVISGPSELITVRTRDRTILLDPISGREIRQISGWTALMYSPDHRQLLLKNVSDTHVLGILDVDHLRSRVVPVLRMPVIVGGGSWLANPISP